MGLLDKLKGRKVILSFEIGVGAKNEVGVKTLIAQPVVDPLEWVRFWTFATARILYEIWYTNTPQGFVALEHLGMVIERPLDPAADFLRRAEFFQFRFAGDVPSPVDLLAGEYLGHEDVTRSIRFTEKLPFDGNMPRPILMFSSIALLRHVTDQIKSHPRALQVLSSAGRMLVSQFANEQWEGEASANKLPQAAFQQALA